MRKEYNLSITDFNDTGEVSRPDGSFVALDKISIERNGEYIRVLSYDYASHTLGVAICSCGNQIGEQEITLTLADGSIFYPAPCCGKAIFFDGVNENDR